MAKRKGKWVSTDAWRGYQQPAGAIAGASDTGSWSDNPCPSIEVKKEIDMLKKELEESGIRTTEKLTRSSNVFMAKRWLIALPEKEVFGKQLAKKLIKKHEAETHYIHGAD